MTEVSQKIEEEMNIVSKENYNLSSDNTDQTINQETSKLNNENNKNNENSEQQQDTPKCEISKTSNNNSTVKQSNKKPKLVQTQLVFNVVKKGTNQKEKKQVFQESNIEESIKPQIIQNNDNDSDSSVIVNEESNKAPIQYQFHTKKQQKQTKKRKNSDADYSDSSISLTSMSENSEIFINTGKQRVQRKAPVKQAKTKSLQRPQLHYKRNSKNEIIYPIQINDTLILENPGQICQQRNYATKYNIYPIGFKTTRIYGSMQDYKKKIKYTCEVLEGSRGKPLFKVTNTETGQEFKSESSSSCWITIAKEVRGQQGFNKDKVTISGPERYGFMERDIVFILESLPDSDKLPKYEHKYIKPKQDEESQEEQSQSEEAVKKSTEDQQESIVQDDESIKDSLDNTQQLEKSNENSNENDDKENVDPAQ